jgi:parvulin-like peptidyl-prolyl isomerase
VSRRTIALFAAALLALVAVGCGGDDAAAKAERERLEAQALSTLLMAEALEQEAADRDIEVSDAEVRQRWQNRTACADGYTATGCTTR